MAFYNVKDWDNDLEKQLEERQSEQQVVLPPINPNIASIPWGYQRKNLSNYERMLPELGFQNNLRPIHQTFQNPPSHPEQWSQFPSINHNTTNNVKSKFTPRKPNYPKNFLDESDNTDPFNRNTIWSTRPYGNNSEIFKN